SMGGTSPILKYIFDNLTATNSKLMQVQRLVDRTGSGTYETNTYTYGPSGNNLNRLDSIYDARNILTLTNIYANTSGDLASQTDAAGRTTSFILDSSNNLTVTHAWTDGDGPHTRQAEVQHDESGAVSSIARPSNDSGAMQTSSTLIYDDRGRLTGQTDADK